MLNNRQFGILTIVVVSTVTINLFLFRRYNSEVKCGQNSQGCSKVNAVSDAGVGKSSPILVDSVSPVVVDSKGGSFYEYEQQQIDLLERSMKSIVAIYTTIERQVNQINPFFFFGNPFGNFGDFGDFFGRPRNGSGQVRKPQTQKQTGYGSGVIVESNDKETFILTNSHVVEGGSKVEVLYNNRKYEAKVLGSDSVVDLALLKIVEKNLPSLPFGNSDKLRMGSIVYSLGNPGMYSNTASRGMVTSNIHRGISEDNSGTLSTIQTDAMMFHGSSGGALIDSRGYVVGINVAMAAPNGQEFPYITFAIPINTARKAISDFKEYGYIQRVVLGIVGASVSDELVKQKKLKVYQGVYVESVENTSPLKKVGVKGGDVIVSITLEYKDDASGGAVQNTIDIHDMVRLQEVVSTISPGTNVVLHVDRSGKKLDFKVKLGRESNVKIVDNGKELIVNGATIKELTEKQLKALKDGGSGDNIVVGGVMLSKRGPDSKRWGEMKEGFVITSVDNVNITSCSDFKEQIRGKRRVMLSGVYLNDPKKEYVYVLDLM